MLIDRDLIDVLLAFCAGALIISLCTILFHSADEPEAVANTGAISYRLGGQIEIETGAQNIRLDHGVLVYEKDGFMHIIGPDRMPVWRLDDE